MDNENEMNEIQKHQAIARMNRFKNTTMTVQELYDKLGEFTSSRYFRRRSIMAETSSAGRFQFSVEKA